MIGSVGNFSGHVLFFASLQLCCSRHIYFPSLNALDCPLGGGMRQLSSEINPAILSNQATDDEQMTIEILVLISYAMEDLLGDMSQISPDLECSHSHKLNLDDIQKARNCGFGALHIQMPHTAYFQAFQYFYTAFIGLVIRPGYLCNA